MWNTVHKVHKGSFLFPSRINKLNYILYHWGRQNLIILAKLCEQTLCLSFHFCSRKPPPKKGKKNKKQKKPASLPTEMHIGNPLTQRHHLPVCTEQQQPLWILNLNGLIEPPTPICSKAASEPLSSKLWSPCRSFFFFFFHQPIQDLPAP